MLYNYHFIVISLTTSQNSSYRQFLCIPEIFSHNIIFTGCGHAVTMELMISVTNNESLIRYPFDQIMSNITASLRVIYSDNSIFQIIACGVYKT